MQEACYKVVQILFYCYLLSVRNWVKSHLKAGKQFLLELKAVLVWENMLIAASGRKEEMRQFDSWTSLNLEIGKLPHMRKIKEFVEFR